MTDNHNDHNQNDQENHDDCQDCIRQRAQNEKFIQIYQKLQQVDQRTSNIKESVGSHKNDIQNSIKVMKKMDQKVEKIKNRKQQQNKSQFQQLGFTLFAQILEKQKKCQLQKENQRLKQIIKELYNQRSRVKQQVIEKPIERNKSILAQQEKSLKLNKKSEQKTAVQWFSKDQVSSRSQSRRQQNTFRDTEMGKSFQIFSTKSSFNTTKRKTFEKKDFGSLNLWLFEQRNQILQKQLYDKNKEEKNMDEIFKTKNRFQLNRSERYTQVTKNNAKFNDSSISQSQNLGKLKNLSKGQNGKLNGLKDLNYSQNRRILKTDRRDSVIPSFQSSSNRFLSKRVKNIPTLPLISNK